MPLHDWTRVEAGTFHDFHQGWTIEIRNALNRGLLPDGFVAATDQRVSGYEPDVSVHSRPTRAAPAAVSGGLAVAVAPPRMKRVAQLETEAEAFARRKNRIVVRHSRGEVVAVIEVVSPGNKDRDHSVSRILGKVREFLRHGLSVLLIDPFPPGEFDPVGLHGAIRAAWLGDTAHAEDPPPAVVSYDAGEPLTAYLEPLAIGGELPDAPLFLEPGVYIPLPLEATYRAAWDNMGRDVRDFFSEWGNTTGT